MTQGDLISPDHKQFSRPKATGASLIAGTFATVNASDPRAYVTAGADEVDPAYPVVPKNVTGEAEGQSPPSMLTYANAETEVSLLEEGDIEMIVANAATVFIDQKVKTAANGHVTPYVDGVDTDFRLIKGVCKSAKVVGNGVLTAVIRIGKVAN